MFYNSAVGQGVCAAGGSHVAQGFNFVLAHDIPFGTGHVSSGFDFVLPHDLPPTLDFDYNPIVFDNGVPVGGWAHLTIRQDGSFTFFGHLHDSGGTEYDVNVGIAVKDSQNRLYTVMHSGHVSGTFEPGSRDDDWSVDSKNDQLAENWADIAASNTVYENASASLDAINLINSIIGAAGLIVGVVALA
jgi:hypothetical protein